MIDHLLPLLVAVPTLAAVVPLFLAPVSRRGARAAVLAALVAQVGLAATLAWVVAAGPVAYVVGGLPAAVGIGLAADRLTATLAVVIAVGALAAALTDDRPTAGPTGTLWLALVAGLTGVVVTADVFNLYVFLEISGLAAYALVASARGADAALAALQYLLVGTVGATLYLLGVGYLFVATGTLAISELAVALAAAGPTPLVVTAFVLIAVGLGVKLAVFPLHAWKPDAYAAAPPAVATLLATLGSTVAGYALARLTFGVFGAATLAALPTLRTAALLVAAVSVVAGGLLAVRASDVRRLLAYSSVSQFGLFVVGLALATPATVTGALVVLVGGAAAKCGLFVAVGRVAAREGATTVADYAGLAARAPVTAAAVAVLGVSLVGLPPTVGFAGKWYLGVGAADAGAWGALAVVLASTLLSLAYVGRLVERAYLASPDVTPPVDARADGGVDSGPAVDDGVDSAPPVDGTDSATVVLVAAAVAVVALGLGSSALAAWLAPVVEVWL